MRDSHHKFSKYEKKDFWSRCDHVLWNVKKMSMEELKKRPNDRQQSYTYVGTELNVGQSAAGITDIPGNVFPVEYHLFN